MKKLDPDICRRIRDARKAAKLSQSVVAEEVGCKQSALSMFEQGDGTKISEEAVVKLAKKFSISLDATPSAGGDSQPVLSTLLPAVGFCPNPNCPTNHAYRVDGLEYRRPDRAAADPVGGRFCAMCGEVLEKKCPSCGASVHDGAVCSFCGSPYVAVLQGRG